jgi:hypothetical protein
MHFATETSLKVWSGHKSTDRLDQDLGLGRLWWVVRPKLFRRGWCHASGRIALPDRALWYIGQAPCGVAWYTATECVALVYGYTTYPAAPCRHDYSGNRESVATHGIGVAAASGYAVVALEGMAQQGIPAAPGSTS